MPTTYFIIVSGKPQTDVIARTIINECVPHSCNVLVSAGYVSNDDDCGYSFDLNGRTRLFDTLEDGFCNHISQFISAACLSAQTSHVNLFFLDNPYGEKDLDLSAFVKLIETVKKPTHGFDLVDIWHVVLGYDTLEPQNVVAHPADEVMQNIFTINKQSNISTLYIGSQYINGGANFTSTEHHDFHLPRMLADFMLVASDPQSASGIVTAAMPAYSKSKAFSIGHAECMYMASDVQKLLGLYLEEVLTKLQLNGTSLSATFPKGKKTQRDKLSRQFSSPYNYSQPVEEGNYLARIDKLITTDFLPFGGKDSFLGENICTYNEVHKAWSDYQAACKNKTDREQVEKRQIFEDKRNAYENIREKIANSGFYSFLSSSLADLNEGRRKKENEKRELEEEKENRSFFKRIIEFFTGASARRMSIIAELSRQLEDLDSKIKEYETAITAHDLVCNYETCHNELVQLTSDVAALENRLINIQKDIKNFRLTEFSDAIPLTNIDLLRSYFSKKCEEYQKEIVEEYNISIDNLSGNLDSAFNRIVAREQQKYETVDWSNPFEFINVDNIGLTYKRLQEKSLPCIHAENSDGGKIFSKIETFVYANHEGFAQQKLSEMSVSYFTQRSTSVKDKICMLQIVALNGTHVDNLIGKTLPEEAETVCDGANVIFEESDMYDVHENQTKPSLNDGQKLLQSLNFIAAKMYFLDKGDLKMVKQCNDLIRGKKLIDEVALSSIDSLKDAPKDEILKVYSLFLKFGISYNPLISIIKELNKQ